jgi:cell division septation protein DedD
VTTDEGFREIQLNGKQLVFLFMAATVVSVVIFLCGVLVGRDVRQDRPARPESGPAGIAPDSMPPGTAAVPAAQAAAAGQLPADPPAPAEDLTYFNRLQDAAAPADTLKPAAPRPGSTPRARGAASGAKPARQPAASDARSISEPAGSGYAVQVVTYNDRRTAEAMAKRLSDKGYRAYVTGPVSAGSKTLYRVRVGKYKEKREADATARRLTVEEQFTPWVTR